MTRPSIGLALLLVGIVAFIVPARALVIDQFDGTVDLEVDSTTPIVTDSSSDPFGIIGGTREVRFELTSASATPPGQATLDIDNVGILDSGLAVGNISGTSLVEITYDRGGAGLGTNLLLNGDTEFEFSVIEGDFPASFSIFLSDGTNSGTSGVVNSPGGVSPFLPGTSPASVRIPFSDPNFASIDFTNIDVIQLQISTPVPSTDVSVDFFGTVPVPAALPLMLTGLAGLGFLDWRRRRSEPRP